MGNEQTNAGAPLYPLACGGRPIVGVGVSSTSSGHGGAVPRRWGWARHSPAGAGGWCGAVGGGLAHGGRGVPVVGAGVSSTAAGHGGAGHGGAGARHRRALRWGGCVVHATARSFAHVTSPLPAGGLPPAAQCSPHCAPRRHLPDGFDPAVSHAEHLIEQIAHHTTVVGQHTHPFANRWFLGAPAEIDHAVLLG